MIHHMDRTVFKAMASAAMLVFAAGAACASSISVPSGTGESPEDFFSARLAGGRKGYISSRKFSKSETEAVRADVWASWKAANDHFSEEKLQPLIPMSWDGSGLWNIPAELEPDAKMPYYWCSRGPALENGYRTFIYLHGSGNPDREWQNGLILSSQFQDSSAFFVPKIPNIGPYYRWWQKGKQYAWEKFIRLGVLSGEIDPDRLFFIGISEGAYGSQRLASYYADYLAGAGPIAGGEPLKNAPVENCANIAFSFRTGAEDKMFYRDILTGYTRDEFDRFEKEHPGYYVHNIEVVPGADHHSIGYFNTTPWLKDFVRNPYPHYVNWENFEMDGNRRNCFYNLAVEEPELENGRRRHYEMKIEGNVVNININDVEYTTTQTDPVYGIEMKFDKKYYPAVGGSVTIYLSDELLDLDSKVTVNLNGRRVWRGRPERRLEDVVNSCALFGDPRRLYTSSITISVKQ